MTHTNAECPLPVLMLARELGWGGGIERDLSKLARRLPAFGIAPHVAYFRGGGERLHEIEAAAIPTMHVPVTSFRSPSVISGARHIARYVTRHQIRILHAFDSTADLFTAPLGRLIGVPVITSHLWCRAMLPRSTQWVLAATDRLAGALYVNCHAVENELTTHWGVPRKRIHVCHNGFEPAEFHPQGRRRPATLADATVVIGTVAVFREEKNLSVLLDAFAKLHSSNPGTRLVMVGDGPMKAALVSQAERLGLGKACLFVPPTASPADWMRAIDIFVLCSRSEAFPNALLEAMACGCCPVASRVGGVAEMISHGTTGLLFDSGNATELAQALGLLLANQAVRTRLADAATQYVHANLTIDIASQRLANIYRSLIGEEVIDYQHTPTELGTSGHDGEGLCAASRE